MSDYDKGFCDGQREAIRRVREILAFAAGENFLNHDERGADAVRDVDDRVRALNAEIQEARHKEEQALVAAKAMEGV